MATVTIPDSTFERLQAIAARRELTIDAYLAEVAAEEEALPTSNSERQLAALEAFAAGVCAHTAGKLPPGQAVDDSRETIYEGRGG